MNDLLPSETLPSELLPSDLDDFLPSDVGMAPVPVLTTPAPATSASPPVAATQLLLRNLAFERQALANTEAGDPGMQAGTDFTTAIGQSIYPKVEYLLHNPITKGLGITLHATGKIISGEAKAATHLLTGNPDLARQEMMAAGDAIATPAGREPAESPWEQGRQTLPLVPRAVAGVESDLLENSPQLALSAADPVLGAVSFGFTPQGFDPVQAGAMLAAPGVGKVIGDAAARLALKAGVTGDRALAAVNRVAGATGAAGTMSAPGVYQISQMPAGPARDRAAEDAAANAIVLGGMGTLGERKNPSVPDSEILPSDRPSTPAPISELEPVPPAPALAPVDLQSAAADLKAALANPFKQAAPAPQVQPGEANLPGGSSSESGLAILPAKEQTIQRGGGDIRDLIYQISSSMALPQDKPIQQDSTQEPSAPLTQSPEREDNSNDEDESSRAVQEIAGDHGSRAEAAAAYLARVGYHVQGVGSGPAEIDRQAGQLTDWVRTQGLLLPAGDLGQFRGQGAEHQVFYRPADGRMVKRTYPGTFGVTPDFKGNQTAATPLYYLRRLGLMNRVFGSDIRMEGIQMGESPIIGQRGEQPAIVTSQPFVLPADPRNPHPTTAEIGTFMREEGFQPRPNSYYGWERPADGVTVLDARPDNFIKAERGIVPVDLVIDQKPTAGPGPRPPQSGWPTSPPESSSESGLAIPPASTRQNQPAAAAPIPAAPVASDLNNAAHAEKQPGTVLNAVGENPKRGLGLQPTAQAIQSFLRTDKVPDGIRIMHDETIPWGAKIEERNNITVNAAQVSTPQRVQQVLLEEGFHGIWNDPALQRVWQSVRDAVTPDEMTAEFQERRAQGLPTDPVTIREEAAITQLVNADANRGIAARLLDTARSAFKRVFGFDLPGSSRQQLRDAALGFLRSRNVWQGADGEFPVPSEGQVEASKAGPLPKLLDIRRSNDEISVGAAKEFASWPEWVKAADGSDIFLKNPENGSFAARIRHLIFDNTLMRLAPQKAQWLPNVPETLKNAEKRLSDPESGNRLYVRTYNDGTKHLVIVRPDGVVEDQKPFSGKLITQFKTDRGGRQGRFPVEWEKGNGQSQGTPVPTPKGS